MMCSNHSQEVGAKIVYEACKAPFRAICENAGKNADAILAKCDDGSTTSGYDARNDEWVDMYSAGIVDPTKVARTALEMATSVTGTLLTTSCVVSLEQVKEEKKQQPAYDY